MSKSLLISKVRQKVEILTNLKFNGRKSKVMKISKNMFNWLVTMFIMFPWHHTPTFPHESCLCKNLLFSIENIKIFFHWKVSDKNVLLTSWTEQESFFCYLFHAKNEAKTLFVFNPEPHSAVRWIGVDDKLIADSRQSFYRVPNRILHTNGSLEVTDIKLDDTGELICEVTISGRRVITQLHSIEVQGEGKLTD